LVFLQDTLVACTTSDDEEVLASMVHPVLCALCSKLERCAEDANTLKACGEQLKEQLADAQKKRSAQHEAKQAELEARVAAKQRELDEALEQHHQAAKLEIKQRERINSACALSAAEARADFEAQLKHAADVLKAEIDAKGEVEKQLDSSVKSLLVAQKQIEIEADRWKHRIAEAELKTDLACAEKAQVEAALCECEADKAATKRECERLRAQLHQKTVAESDQLELGAQNQMHRAKIQRLETLLEEERANNITLRKRPRGFVDEAVQNKRVVETPKY